MSVVMVIVGGSGSGSAEVVVLVVVVAAVAADVGAPYGPMTSGRRNDVLGNLPAFKQCASSVCAVCVQCVMSVLSLPIELTGVVCESRTVFLCVDQPPMTPSYYEWKERVCAEVASASGEVAPTCFSNNVCRCAHRPSKPGVAPLHTPAS